MKILILGCGYLGKAVTTHWVQKGHIVTASTRSPERLPELLKLTPHVTLLPKGSWKSLLSEQDVILISVAPQKGENYRETYLGTVQKVLREGNPNSRILYTSSTSVYGDHTGKVVTEDTPPQPLTENSTLLLNTEELLLQNPFRTCILRLGEIVGPDRMPLDRVKKMEGKEFPGSGLSPVNLSPLPDCVEGLTFALENNLTGVYNLCYPLHMPRKELYTKIALTHSLPPPCWNPTQISPHAGDKIVSSAKIEAAGFKFQTPESYFFH